MEPGHLTYHEQQGKEETQSKEKGQIMSVDRGQTCLAHEAVLVACP